MQNNAHEKPSIILVANDHSTDAIAEFLKQLDYDVTSSEDSQEIKRLLSNRTGEELDNTILICGLLTKEGFRAVDLLSHINSIMSIHIPTLLLHNEHYTGSTSPEELAKLKEQGVISHYQKMPNHKTPFDRAIQQAVQAFDEHHRSEESVQEHPKDQLSSTEQLVSSNCVRTPD